MSEVTEVYFRREKDGEILAVFPDDKELTCYAHIGQHSACTQDYIDEETSPASKKEYADLYKELTELVGYTLKVVTNEG